MDALKTAVNVGSTAFGLATNPVGTVLSTSIFWKLLFKVVFFMMALGVGIWAIVSLSTKKSKKKANKKKSKR